MDDLQPLIDEYQRRTAALEDPEAYRQLIAPSGHADFVYAPAEHHRIIQEACRELILEDTFDVLLLMLPPGAAKSTYGSVQIATWAWAVHPTWKILAVSNITVLAESFARRRRSTCETKEWIRLAETELDPQQYNIAEFGNKAGGVMYARGAGSATAGIRANLFIWDDLISSLEEAQSPSQLDKLWNWYKADARPRLVPSGKEIGIMTRWSRQDPMGRILERIKDGTEAKRVKIIRIPMLADLKDGPDPLGRKEGEPLWTEWYTEAQLKDAMETPATFQALYQQIPPDQAGSWVPEECIQHIDRQHVPDLCKDIMAADIALSVNKGDYTVIGRGKVDDKRNLYLYDVYRDQVAPGTTVKKMSAMYEASGAPCVFIDNDNASKMFIETMMEYSRNGVAPVPLKTVPLAGNDKEWRAAPLRDMFLNMKVFFVRAPWNVHAANEVMTFPPKSRMDHDDIIDVLALMARQIWKVATPQKPARDVAKPIEGAYIVRDGKVFTRQPLKDLWDEPKSNQKYSTVRIGRGRRR